MNKTSDIRTRRLALGLPQGEVANRARVSETQIRKWERGLELPDHDSVVRIARILDIDPDRLFRAQLKHTKKVTPGEGYTTAEAGDGEGHSAPG